MVAFDVVAGYQLEVVEEACEVEVAWQLGRAATFCDLQVDSGKGGLLTQAPISKFLHCCLS